MTAPWATLAGRYAPDPYPTPGALAEALTGGQEMQAAHLDAIDALLVRALAGEALRVVVSMPPQHGKSRRLVRWGALWWLAHRPDDRVVVASYGQEFVAKHGRWVRSQVEASADRHRRDVPDLGLRLDPESRAADRWDLDGRDGGLVAVGRGGALTGNAARLLLVDDAVKDAAEASSRAVRDATAEWFATVAMTRLRPKAAVIVCATRWHPDDLSGRLLADGWESLVLPALAGQDDPLGRQPGEALWPAEYDAGWLARQRASIGERQFGSLYQADPRPDGASLWRQEWIEAGRRPEVARMGDAPGRLRAACLALDPSDGKSTGDAQGWCLAGLGFDHELYVLAAGQDRLPPDEWLRAKVDRAAAGHEATGWEPVPLLVEVDREGEVLLRLLERVMAEHGRRVKVVPLRSGGLSKRQRATPVALLYEQGRVHHVGTGLGLLEDEQLSWSGAASDDSPNVLDACVHALTWLSRQGDGVGAAGLVQAGRPRLPVVARSPAAQAYAAMGGGITGRPGTVEHFEQLQDRALGRRPQYPGVAYPW